MNPLLLLKSKLFYKRLILVLGNVSIASQLKERAFMNNLNRDPNIVRREDILRVSFPIIPSILCMHCIQTKTHAHRWTKEGEREREQESRQTYLHESTERLKRSQLWKERKIKKLTNESARKYFDRGKGELFSRRNSFSKEKLSIVRAILSESSNYLNFPALFAAEQFSLFIRQDVDSKGFF